MGEPIRVAHVMGKMVGGGVEQVVMNYYRHIDRSKVQFDFLVDADSTLVPTEEIESLGGRVFVVPPYQNVLEYQQALKSLFRVQGWEIVHSHINALSVFPLHAAKKAGVPVRIAHSHSTSGKGEYAKNALKAVLRTQANRYPTHRFACSELAGKWLFGEGSDFEVIHNAVDLSRFIFDVDTRAEARAALGLVGVEAQVAGLPCFLSDAITREVDVTGTSRFLPIDDPRVWADVICGTGQRTNEERASFRASAFADYDIERQGARLTEKYLSLHKEMR